MTSDRRKFIKTTSFFGLGAIVAGLGYLFSGESLFTKSLFNDLENIRSLGGELSSFIYYEKKELEELRLKLETEFQANNSSEFSELVSQRVKMDFKQKNTHTVEGWVLSDTEVKICILISRFNTV